MSAAPCSSTWAASSVAIPLGSEPQGLLKDVGVGLRFGNSRSALGNVLHVDFAFPLDGDPSISSMQIVVETKRRF